MAKARKKPDTNPDLFDTLVAIVPRKKDFRILQEEHWYRIPVAKAPEYLPKIKYLAFYQPKIFEEEKWAVNYYAKVLRIEKVKRIELLPDEPKHIRAEEDYYQIFVDDLIRLDRPIKSQRWRRIVFLPTTRKKIFEAKEINDLFLTSSIEERLYQALKKRRVNPERQYFVAGDRWSYCLDFAIFCRDGKIDIECDGAPFHSTKDAQIRDRKRDNELTSMGWHILRFPDEEIVKDLRGCAKQILRTIRYLKGM